MGGPELTVQNANLSDDVGAQVRVPHRERDRGVVQADSTEEPPSMDDLDSSHPANDSDVR